MRRQTRARSVAGVCAGVAVATLMAACGSSSSSSSGSAGASSSAGSSTSASASASSSKNAKFLDGSMSAKQLVTAANSEGELNWTTSLAGPVVDALVAGFNAKYPNVNVNVDRGDEGVIIPQEIQSATAGVALGDVFEVTASGALTFDDANDLAPFQTSEDKAVPAQFRIGTGASTKAVSDRVSYISFGYNKKNIPAADVPKTLQDLANPALKGKLAMETDTTSEDWVGAVLNQLGQSAGEAFLKKLGANGVAQTSQSGAGLMGLVASGQYGGSPSVFHNHEQQDAQSGAPVAWIPIQPVVANVGELGIFANAKDPAAAMLFVEWMLGPQGKKVLEKEDYTPPTVKQPFKSWVPTTGFTSATAFNTKQESWSALQKSDFSN